MNQDNDSVTVFDAVSHLKLREINVGVAPRSIAVAPSGLIWVTNRESATISVIDPASLAVTQTIALPRASQPYGIAFVPGGRHAFVALGATGRGSSNWTPSPSHRSVA